MRLSKREMRTKGLDRESLQTCFRCYVPTANLGPRLYRDSSIRLPAYCTDCLNYFSQKAARDLPSGDKK